MVPLNSPTKKTVILNAVIELLNWPEDNEKSREKKEKQQQNKSNTLYTFFFSREDNNYLTTKESTVKMDMYKTVFNGLLCWTIQVVLVQWE